MTLSIASSAQPGIHLLVEHYTDDDTIHILNEGDFDSIVSQVENIYGCRVHVGEDGVLMPESLIGEAS